MAYEIFRVEITRDETRDNAAALIEITAYFDRMPETNIATRGRLTRAAKGVWNSRLQFTGDFDTLGAALEAIEAAYPEARQIRCYEYTVDDEYARAVAPLVKASGTWAPAAP
jgi:cytochrome c556